MPSLTLTTNSIGEEKVKQTSINMILKIIHDSGHPNHLGFCLHLVLHLSTPTARFKRRNTEEESLSQLSLRPSSLIVRSSLRDPLIETRDQNIDE